jgi:LmeA-like phospholipid-binding
MSNPPGPPSNDPQRGRPAGPPNRGVPPRRVPPPPSESPTRHIPQPGRPQQPSARDVPRPQQPGRPPGRPPQQPAPPPNRPPQQPNPPQSGLPPNPRPRQPGPPPPAHENLTTRISIPTPPPGAAHPADESGGRGFFANRTSLLLILLIVALVVIAIPIGGELYARHVASTKVANAVQCEVQDSAKVSFSPAPPVLWQYLTDHYSDISVQTGGNQVRQAKGMKVSLDIRDIKLSQTNNSAGTIGSLNGTITWSADGIKQSIQDAIPVLGKFVTGEVTTNPGDGTVALKGLLNSAVVKPQIVNNGLSLQVVSLSALGSNMSTDDVQKHLDDLTSKATQNYPLGIHADSVKVTNDGVEATFSTQNATIPTSSSQPQSGQDCFSGV